MELRDTLPVFDLAIRAYRASHDFLGYVRGEPLDKISYDAKDVALKHFLYPMLQIVGTDEAMRESIRQEIERIQQHMAGG